MSFGMGRIDFARSRVGEFFDSTCTIRRAGAVLYEDVPCTVEDGNQSTQRLGGENVPADALLLAIPVDGYDIRQGDFVTEQGRVLEVTAAVTPKSYEVRREAICLIVGTEE